MLDAVLKDLLIRKIELACYVPSGTHKPVHIDRPSSGFAYQCNRSAVFQFVNNERMTIKEGEIIFLPKGSSYTVSMASPGDCYAVNFQSEVHVPALPDDLSDGIREFFRLQTLRKKRPDSPGGK